MKPQYSEEYSSEQTALCEQTLVTLMRRLGPWKKSVYLTGGLVPRYLIDRQSHGTLVNSPHAGTRDVDLVLDLVMLAEVEAYKKLEKNLKDIGFEREKNEDGNPKHYSWSMQVTERDKVVLDLLCDQIAGDDGTPISIPNERRLSALQIRGAHLVIQDHIDVQITCQQLGNRGVTTETIKVANIVPFIVLKLLAHEDRQERKDAYDVIYCLMNYRNGPEDVAVAFAKCVAESPDEPLFLDAIKIFRNRFASDERTEGFRKDGAVSYATFLTGLGPSDLHIQKQRDVQDVVETFLAHFDKLTGNDGT